MFFTFVLVTALTTSAVLGRSTGPAPRQLTFVQEDISEKTFDDTAQLVTNDDRSSNLKYVMVIQSSSIWDEIKTRSLTMKTPQQLDDTDKSPEDLTDQELAQVKQACHDGLKCVAVDQLLMLNQIEKPLDGGQVSVRTVITKITQVITEYTTEYHKDVYRYEAVKQSDDKSKVYESLTTIVEDNKELCQIDLTPDTEGSHEKPVDGKTDAAVVNNYSTVNYNTTENYNVNNGTVNSVDINIEPHSGGTVDGDRADHKTPTVDIDVNTAAAAERPAVIESKNHCPFHRDANADHQCTALAIVNSAPAGDESVTEAPENGVRPRPAGPNAQGGGTSDRRFEPVKPEHARSTGDRRKPVGQQLMITDGPSPRDGVVSDNGAGGKKARRPRPDVSGRTNGARADEPAAINKIVLKRPDGIDFADHSGTEKTAGAVNDNTVELDNSSGRTGAGENDFDSDIVSAGSHNLYSSKKGFVEDGFLNNGKMTVNDVDNSNRNRGTLEGAKANDGIINVGTTNNKPITYGTTSDNTNSGTASDMDGYQIRQYVDDIDKMYSTILSEFAKK